MSSSRDGAEGQAARARSAGSGAMDEEARDEEARQKGVTRITSAERDPIAAALRRVYNDAATEPLPEDLNRLLSELEAAEKNA